MSEFDEMDNATLMKSVQGMRGLLWEAKGLDLVADTVWETIHKMRKAEALMKVRNLPLDHPALGKRFTRVELVEFLVIEGEQEDDTPEDPGDFTGRFA